MTLFSDIVLYYISLIFATIRFQIKISISIFQMCISAGFNFGPGVGNHTDGHYIITTIYDPDPTGSEGSLSQIMPTIDRSNSGEFPV